MSEADSATPLFGRIPQVARATALLVEAVAMAVIVALHEAIVMRAAVQVYLTSRMGVLCGTAAIKLAARPRVGTRDGHTHTANFAECQGIFWRG